MNIVVQRTVIGLNSVSSEVEATALSTELRRYPQYKIAEIAFKHFHETRMASQVDIKILPFSHPIQSYSRVPAISDTYMHVKPHKDLKKFFSVHPLSANIETFKIEPIPSALKATDLPTGLNKISIRLTSKHVFKYITIIEWAGC